MSIVRHLKTNNLYRYLGQDKFKNIVTGAEGIVGEDLANKVFAINLDATVILNENPLVEQLIKNLGLKIIPNES